MTKDDKSIVISEDNKRLYDLYLKDENDLKTESIDLKNVLKNVPDKVYKKIKKTNYKEQISKFTQEEEVHMLHYVIKNSAKEIETLLTNSRASIEEYMNACSFVARLNMGHSIGDAWSAIFPERLDAAISAGKRLIDKRELVEQRKLNAKEESACVRKQVNERARIYSRGCLVTALMKIASIPFYSMFASDRIMVLNGLRDMAIDKSSGAKNQIEASKVFLEHTAEEKDGGFNVNQSKSSTTIISFNRIADEIKKATEDRNVAIRETKLEEIKYKQDA